MSQYQIYVTVKQNKEMITSLSLTSYDLDGFKADEKRAILLLRKGCERVREQVEEAPTEPVVDEVAEEVVLPAAKAQTFNGTGRKGVFWVSCDDCGAEYFQLHKSKVSDILCKCGTSRPVESFAKFRYTCTRCRKVVNGYTNHAGGELEQKHTCGEVNQLSWNVKKGMFTEEVRK